MEDLQSGEVFLDDKKILGPSYNLIPGDEDMKLVSQDFYVLDNHTIEENINDKLIGYPNEAKQKRAAKIMKLLELYNLRNTKARFLSSGQKQRVAIARALAVIPRVLLLDEPFSNLDKLLTEKLFAFVMKEVKRKNTSVILITHLAEEALKYTDSIAVMDDGKITQYGKKWDVYYHPKNSKLAGLLGDYNLVQSADLEKRSKLKITTKLFIRPDRLILSTAKAAYDLRLTVVNCTFNGKCFEVLGENSNGRSFMIYHHEALAMDKEYFFSVKK